MRYLIFLLLICGTAWAGLDELAKEEARLQESNKAPLTANEEADLILKGWRNRRVGEFDPPVSAFSRPSDYSTGVDRGTIEYSPSWKNYSYHKVTIPDGTVISDANFYQKEPETIAITGKNLTFRDCNLINVAIDPSWTVTGSNTAQIKRVLKSEQDMPEGKILTISHQVKQKDGTYLEVSEDVENVSSASLADALLKLNE